MSVIQSQDDQETYSSPRLTNLTPEEAHTLLESEAAKGSKDARDLLDLLSSPSKET